MTASVNVSHPFFECEPALCACVDTAPSVRKRPTGNRYIPQTCPVTCTMMPWQFQWCLEVKGRRVRASTLHLRVERIAKGESKQAHLHGERSVEQEHPLVHPVPQVPVQRLAALHIRHQLLVDVLQAARHLLPTWHAEAPALGLPFAMIGILQPARALSHALRMRSQSRCATCALHSLDRHCTLPSTDVETTDSIRAGCGILVTSSMH